MTYVAFSLYLHKDKASNLNHFLYEDTDLYATNDDGSVLHFLASNDELAKYYRDQAFPKK